MKKRTVIAMVLGISIIVALAGYIVYQQGIYTFLNSSVSRIDTEKAQQLLTKEAPILLDARSSEEFKISHLKEAIWFDSAQLETIRKDATILIYCTIGVRSNKIANELSKKGFTNVYDMREGIVGWANAELPLINQQGFPTQKVHTYNKSFAPLLKKGQATY